LLVQNQEINLPHNWEPWEHQLPGWNAMMKRNIKRAVWVWHRRAGKDLTALNVLVCKALERVGVYWYVLPEYAQARKIIWGGQRDDGKKFIDHIPEELIKRKRDDTMFLELINGSTIHMIGSDKADSLVGTNPVGVIFSEYSIQNPKAWNLVRPILNANNGWAIFVYTPRGYNHGFDLYEMAKKQEEKFPERWHVQLLTVDDTDKILVGDDGNWLKDEDGNWIRGPIVTEEMMDEDRATGMPEEMVQQEYYCFKPEAPVVTTVGIKPIGQIEPGDLVLTDKNRYKPVKNIISRPYSGELVRIKSYGNNDDIICTPEHPIKLVDKSTQTYRWEQAQNIQIGDRLTFPRVNLGKNPIVKKEMAQLIGWFIAEGSISNNQVNFTLNITEVSYQQEIQNLLTSLGYASKVYLNKKGNSQNIVVNSVELQQFLISTCGCGAKYKKIPFGLISSYEKEVFDCLMKGDGCIKTEASHKRQHLLSYATVSQSLAYQVQLLAHSLGYTAGISKRVSSPSQIQGRAIKPGEYYTIQINQPKEATKMGIHKYSVSGYVKEITREQYTGRVYNLSVLGDESYVVCGRSVHNCSFDAAMVGSYYGDLMTAARKEDRIGEFPYDERFPVHTCWDLGKADATSVWFMQIINKKLYWIDYQEWKGKSFQEIIKEVKEKPYVYGTHLGPHDLKVSDYTSRQSRWAIAKGLGIRFSIVPKLSIQDGIDAVRRVLPRSHFDREKAAQGIACLCQYQKTYDDVRKIYSDKPLHNWCSHGSDAFRTYAVGAHFIRENIEDEFNSPGVAKADYDLFTHEGVDKKYIAGSDYDIM